MNGALMQYFSTLVCLTCILQWATVAQGECSWFGNITGSIASVAANVFTETDGNVSGILTGPALDQCSCQMSWAGYAKDMTESSLLLVGTTCSNFQTAECTVPCAQYACAQNESPTVQITQAVWASDCLSVMCAVGVNGNIPYSVQLTFYAGDSSTGGGSSGSADLPNHLSLPLVIGCSVGGTALILIVFGVVYYVRVRRAARGEYEVIKEQGGSKSQSSTIARRTPSLSSYGKAVSSSEGRTVTFLDPSTSAPYSFTLDPGKVGIVAWEDLQIKRQLGQTVRRCQNIYLYTEVVVYAFQVGDSQQSVQSVLDTVQLLANLRHPNLATYSGVCVQEGEIGVVAEYVTGKDFSAFNSDVTAATRDKLLVMVDVARGLCHLHRKGIAHGQLTARRIVIDQSRRARLVRYGLLENELLRAAELKRQRPVDQQSVNPIAREISADVYMFAIVLVESIAGRGAVPRGDMPLTLPAIATIDGGLAALMRTCLDRDPASRPSMTTVLDTLVQLTSGTVN